MIRLVELADADFDWISGSLPPRIPELTLPPGGVDSPIVLSIIRRMVQGLYESGCKGAWMAVVDNEVVGICSYKSPPLQGSAEIGYGVAESRRGRGYATAAVASMIQITRQRPDIRSLVAETATDNNASRRVVEKNGFTLTGLRDDPDDGRLALWELVL
jgi:RimJ/RimL family protein N-acetyltransferase